jgi:hypothetical protein
MRTQSGHLNISNDTNGNRTRNLPSCRATAPKATAIARIMYGLNELRLSKLSPNSNLLKQHRGIILTRMSHHYFTCTVSRDGKQRSVSRYSSLPSSRGPNALVQYTAANTTVLHTIFEDHTYINV